MNINRLDQNYLKKLTVLYVEDEDDTREQFSDFLRRPVGTLITAANGAEGLEAFIAHAPDIVVTDILMPHMDGLAMAYEIRGIAPSVPIIVVTAFEQADYLMRAVNMGIDKYVVKPVNSYLLFECLLECAHRLRAEELLEQAHRHEVQTMSDKHRKHQEELRSIFELSTAGIVLGDETACITFASSRMAEMLGYPVEELTGSIYLDHIHPGDLWETTEKMQQLLDGKVSSVENEHRYLRKDGTFFWGHLTASCIEDAADEPRTLVAVLSDVSERKNAELERLKLEQQLLHAQKLESVGVLASGIAHDFNNVLTVISGYAELLLISLDKDQKSLLFVKEISASVGRAADMTRGLLAFGGKSDMLLTHVDLNQILTNVCKSLVRLVREDIVLSVDSCEDKLPVHVDRVQIEQLLYNLVVNAGDAIFNGGNITVATQLVVCERVFIEGNAVIPPGCYACLSVTDSGCGMNAATIEQIFESFFTTKAQGKGTGLGLAIGHGIVTRHNGFLSVISVLEKGTTFRIYLPLYAGEVPLKMSEMAHAIDLQGTETVLIVEDDPAIIKLHKEMLGRCGYTVLSARDGVEALELFAIHGARIRIVITDVIMSRMNGSDLVREIRRNSPEMPILMTSGYCDDVIDRAAIDALNVIFHQKPVKRIDLLAALRVCLNKKNI